MAQPIYATLSATGTTRSINLDRFQSPFNVSVAVTYATTTMTATYGVEYTLDDAQYLAAIGSTKAISWLPDANLPAGTSSGNVTTNYTFPVSAVRMTVTAVSSSSVTICVTQGGAA